MNTTDPYLFRLLVGLHSPCERDANTTGAVEFRAAQALSILLDFFPDATATRGLGVWEDSEEPTLILERYGVGSDIETMRTIAERIRDALNQDAVGLAALPVATFELI